jgi:hypothetical protein
VLLHEAAALVALGAPLVLQQRRDAAASRSKKAVAYVATGSSVDIIGGYQW